MTRKEIANEALNSILEAAIGGELYRVRYQVPGSLEAAACWTRIDKYLQYWELVQTGLNRPGGDE